MPWSKAKLLRSPRSPFDYGVLPSIYRWLHCGDCDDILADPAPLLKPLDALNNCRGSHSPATPRSTSPAAHHLRLAPVRPRDRDGGPEQGLGQRRGGQDQCRRARRHGRNRQDRARQPLRAGPRGQGWRGAEAVFVWSFYSQGTDDKRQASADDFFKTALAWFGHTGDAQLSPHDKGVRLAELIAAKRALVILDGLEPLQYGPSRRSGGSGDAGLTGGLKDHGLRALLRQLAAANPGLLSRHHPPRGARTRWAARPCRDHRAPRTDPNPGRHRADPHHRRQGQGRGAGGAGGGPCRPRHRADSRGDLARQVPRRRRALQATSCRRWSISAAPTSAIRSA